MHLGPFLAPLVRDFWNRIVGRGRRHCKSPDGRFKSGRFILEPVGAVGGPRHLLAGCGEAASPQHYPGYVNGYWDLNRDRAGAGFPLGMGVGVGL